MTMTDKWQYYITYTIVIQAKKIDVDFRGDSLATNKEDVESISRDSYNFL